MRCQVIILLIVHVIVLLAAGGCSQVNVEAKDESVPEHEKIFRDELAGRSDDAVRPRVLELPEVRYPAEAADLGISGLAMIRILVGQDGQVQEAEVSQGLHPLIDTVALETARGGSYAPAMQRGIAVDGWLTVPFRYPPVSQE